MAKSLPELDRIDRALLVTSDGVRFADFRRTLRPRYWRVWVDIGLGYLAIMLIISMMVLAEQNFPSWWPLFALLGAVALGYAIAYLQLFFHEAAHILIAPGRRRNDLLANIFIGSMVGQDIKAYRRFHFEHHRHLGTPLDTERSYFEAINARFLLEALFGIKLLHAMRLRDTHRDQAGNDQESRRRALGMLSVALVINVAILAAAVWNGVWSVAVAWAAGMLLVHPALNVVRQALEHRDFRADATVDYASVPHGPITRMFGTGVIASSLGGAGFNRHLLHHWEPQISYTRLADLERFLLDTPAREVLLGAGSSYAGAFGRLVRQG